MNVHVRLLALAAAASLVSVASAGAQQAAQAPDDGKPRFTFYGSIVANASVADAAVFGSDIPWWAVQGAQTLLPPSIGSQQPQSLVASDVNNFEATARQSRLGVRIDVPRGQGRWTPAGQLEIDFLGARPAAGQGTVFNQPRLRIAMVSLRHASGWTFGAGQDWVVFAPANPTSFAHFAIPEAAGGGNPWARLPQFRVEKRPSGSRGLLLQAALLRPQGGGEATSAGSLVDAVAQSGERSGQPFYQARLAYAGTAHGRPQSLGVSVHYGREKAEPETLTTWGVAVDGAVALGSRVSLTGEVWQGENLDTFQAGILQGVTQLSGAFKSVAALGGWLQGSVAASKTLTLNAGLGVDDPDDDALTVLVPRARNQVAWANLMLKAHQAVTVAFEYNRFDTTFRTSPTGPERKGTGNYGNVAVVLTF